MGAPARQRMGLAEFLAWEPPGELKYELIDGVPVAMAPASGAHGLLAMALGRHIGNALASRPPCTVRAEAGVALPDRADSWYVADLAVTCTPHRPGEIAIPDPVCLVEVLSPRTERRDREIKLPNYRRLPSLREVVLLSSESVYAEVHRRLDAERWLTDLLQGGEAVLRLESCGLEVTLGELYADIAFEAAG